MIKPITLLGGLCVLTACQSSPTDDTVLAFAAGTGTYRLTPQCTEYASVYHDKEEKPFVWIQMKNSLRCSQRAYTDVFSQSDAPLYVYFQGQEMTGRIDQIVGGLTPVTLFLVPARGNEAIASEVAHALRE